jgi:uncharacterized membrane protein YbhN (UPF0104 family)
VWLLRLLVSAAVLGILLTRVPIGSVGRALGAVPLGLWAFVVLLFLAGHVAAALKWRILLGLRQPVPAEHALRAHFAGLLANLCLPGVAGGDLVRAGWLMRRLGRHSDVAVAGVVDRGLDCLALLLLAAAGALWTAQASEPAARALMTAGGLLLLGGVVSGFVYLALRRRPAEGFGGRLAASIEAVLRNPRAAAGCLVLSLGVQAAFVVLNAGLGRAAGVPAPLGAWFVAWPLAKLVAILPVSMAGLGLREAALVIFMRPFGVAAAGVVAASLLWEGVLYAGGLLAGLVSLVSRDASRVARRGATPV